MEFLPKPEIVRCFRDINLNGAIPAMELRWHAEAPGTVERAWHLPHGVTVHSAAPTRFGIAIERLGEDAYKVQLVWNRLTLAWHPLTRVQIMTSSLSLVLHALGTDMWHLLHQPFAVAA
ncbi:MAG: hypothetical protein L0Y71_14170 [Gemmataceae bacterium]|nr:hypothetical protein [Gemmataceae bacterium]